jgi:type II secretory pathway component PulF
MKAAATPLPWQREYFSVGYKVTFLNAIHLRMQAGESVGQALTAVILAEHNAHKLRDMRPALQALEQGESVTTAMGQLGFFDKTALAIFQAGERSGMREAIHSAASHLSVKQAWLRQHALVIFILVNELISAVLAPIALHQQILPWIREHITPPAAADALQAYQRDMAIADDLTMGLIVLTALLMLLGAINLYGISQLRAPTRLLMFFSDSAMSVGFRVAAAMLKAGVTLEQTAHDLAHQAPGWSRQFWAAVHQQLRLACEPAQALMQLGLYPDERSLLANHANARQLAETFAVLADDRQQKARRGRDLLLLGATALTITYILMSLGIAIWMYMTYSNTLSAGLDALGNGF